MGRYEWPPGHLSLGRKIRSENFMRIARFLTPKRGIDRTKCTTASGRPSNIHLGSSEQNDTQTERLITWGMRGLRSRSVPRGWTGTRAIITSHLMFFDSTHRPMITLAAKSDEKRA